MFLEGERLNRKKRRKMRKMGVGGSFEKVGVFGEVWGLEKGK